jgi:hypothetical protein
MKTQKKDLITVAYDKGIKDILKEVAETGSDVHENYTPAEICGTMLDKVDLSKAKTVLVLYNIELLFALMLRKFSGHVTFFTQSQEKAGLAPKFFPNLTVEYIDKGENPIIYMENKWPEKFDVVIANPPYTNGKDKHFYVKFIDLSVKITKDGGTCSMITPNTWIENNHSVFKKLSLNGCFNEIVENNGDKDFGIALGRKTSYFVYEKGSKLRGVLKHSKLDSKDQTLMDIVSKIYGLPIKGKGGQSGLEMRDFSESRTNVYNYPVFLSSGERSNLFYHSPIKGSGISKLIVSNILEAGKAQRFSEVSTEKGVGRYSAYYEMKMDEAINAQCWFDTICFKFCDSLTRKGRYTIKCLPSLDFSQACTDEKIFKQRGLTDEEILIIKNHVGNS